MKENKDVEAGISKEPVNILFSPSTIPKKNVWDIDLVQILDILMQILQKSKKKDLRVAGMAALSSSLIYGMKVASIAALEKAPLEKKPLIKRTDVNIDLINIPYRHELTYPVSMDDLLDLLENLINSIATRQIKKDKSILDPSPPRFEELLIENIITKYEDMIMKNISDTGFGYLQAITANLDIVESIRCFFAILFLAKDEKIEIEQNQGEDKVGDIKIILNKKSLDK